MDTLLSYKSCETHVHLPIRYGGNRNADEITNVVQCSSDWKPSFLGQCDRSPVWLLLRNMHTSLSGYFTKGCSLALVRDKCCDMLSETLLDSWSYFMSELISCHVASVAGWVYFLWIRGWENGVSFAISLCQCECYRGNETNSFDITTGEVCHFVSGNGDSVCESTFCVAAFLRVLEGCFNVNLEISLIRSLYVYYYITCIHKCFSQCRHIFHNIVIVCVVIYTWNSGCNRGLF